MRGWNLVQGAQKARNEMPAEMIEIVGAYGSCRDGQFRRKLARGYGRPSCRVAAEGREIRRGAWSLVHTSVAGRINVPSAAMAQIVARRTKFAMRKKPPSYRAPRAVP